jgi:GH15 family glucan-1,4-alpha-glucosidase
VPRDAPAAAIGQQRGVGRSIGSIGDHALIGDCRTAALISRDGAIGWWCLPHFASASIFGALLDAGRGGACRVAPVAAAQAARRYRPGTNVLETTLTTADGAIRVVDCMPLPCGTSELRPMREILRCVDGLTGAVRVRVVIDPRPDYGRVQPRLERRRADLWAWTWAGNLLLVQTGVALAQEDGALVAELVLNAGDRAWLSLSFVEGDVGIVPGLGRAAEQRLAQTTDWWERWSRRARYAGPYREAVVRSALALKLMCSAQSAAVVAAPSTSLPEWPGGTRNWDYRYCWLRDAALTMRAFTGLGYLDEGRAFLDWLLHATRLTWPRLQVLYDIYGRAPAAEEDLPHWAGFRRSRPVRIGNAAQAQLQLDVYGAVCFAADNLVSATGTLPADEARLLRGFGDEVCAQWQRPDHSIWEIRGTPRHYTFSKIMCWTALDALVRLAASGRVKLKAHVGATAAAIRAAVEHRGYAASLGSYTGTLDGGDADASLLLAGCLGYRDPRDQRMRGTYDYVHRRLGRNGLLLRYAPAWDGIDEPEGAFSICSFFAIDHLVGRGELDEARDAFEHVLSFANDVGLLSEEIDPDSGELLGNFPQAYTHVGLINAALALARAEETA